MGVTEEEGANRSRRVAEGWRWGQFFPGITLMIMAVIGQAMPSSPQHIFDPSEAYPPPSFILVNDR